MFVLHTYLYAFQPFPIFGEMVESDELRDLSGSLLLGGSIVGCDGVVAGTKDQARLLVVGVRGKANERESFGFELDTEARLDELDE